MKKKVIVILCSIVVFAGITAGAYFITNAIIGSKAVSAAEFLVSGHKWQKNGEETVVWTFENEGKCSVTTNSTETFDCHWQLEDETLTIETDWLRTLRDEFGISIDESGKTFTVTSKSDEKISTFSQVSE